MRRNGFVLSVLSLVFLLNGLFVVPMVLLDFRGPHAGLALATARNATQMRTHFRLGTEVHGGVSLLQFQSESATAL